MQLYIADEGKPILHPAHGLKAWRLTAPHTSKNPQNYSICHNVHKNRWRHHHDHVMHATHINRLINYCFISFTVSVLLWICRNASTVTLVLYCIIKAKLNYIRIHLQRLRRCCCFYKILMKKIFSSFVVYLAELELLWSKCLVNEWMNFADFSTLCGGKNKNSPRKRFQNVSAHTFQNWHFVQFHWIQSYHRFILP